MTTKKNAAAAAKTQKPVVTGMEVGQQTVEAVMKAGTDAMKGYEDAVAMTKKQVEEASGALFKGYDELAVVGKANVDAMVLSSTIAAKGYEKLGKEVMAFAQTSMQDTAATAQAVLGAKTLRDMIDLQAEFSRKSFDKAMAESAKLTEMSVQVANDAIEPLQVRVNEAVETMMKPMAA